MMIREQIRIGIPDLQQQPRRALDVAKQEGNRAARKLAHPIIIPDLRLRHGRLGFADSHPVRNRASAQPSAAAERGASTRSRRRAIIAGCTSGTA
jgi:hypothetical protein